MKQALEVMPYEDRLKKPGRFNMERRREGRRQVLIHERKTLIPITAEIMDRNNEYKLKLPRFYLTTMGNFLLVISIYFPCMGLYKEKTYEFSIRCFFGMVSSTIIQSSLILCCHAIGTIPFSPGLYCADNLKE